MLSMQTLHDTNSRQSAFFACACTSNTCKHKSSTNKLGNQQTMMSLLPFFQASHSEKFVDSLTDTIQSTGCARLVNLHSSALRLARALCAARQGLLHLRTR